ncbi:ribosome maturation factor RimP [Candidatus Omnitrophota bacterium]
MISQEIEDSIKSLIAPILQEHNLSLIETGLSLWGRRWTLRLFIDKINGGITLDECASLNQRIGDIIDREGIIKHSYVLEVSSPGLDRPLRTYEDFIRCLNRRVRVFFGEPVDDKHEVGGIVVSVGETGIELDSGGQVRHIAFTQIRKAKQVIEEIQ